MTNNELTDKELPPHEAWLAAHEVSQMHPTLSVVREDPESLAIRVRPDDNPSSRADALITVGLDRSDGQPNLVIAVMDERAASPQSAARYVVRSEDKRRWLERTDGQDIIFPDQLLNTVRSGAALLEAYLALPPQAALHVPINKVVDWTAPAHSYLNQPDRRPQPPTDTSPSNQSAEFLNHLKQLISPN